MIETFKKWFGKKEEVKEPDNFTYKAIISFLDGSTLEVLTYYWENPNQASRRFADALECNEWFFVKAVSGERVILQSKDVERVTINPEPVKED